MRQQTISDRRHSQPLLVTELRDKGIQNERVLQAISRVPRDNFVPDGFRARAYENEALPIACGQTISQPYTVARMTELIEPVEGMKVLEIGTGSGYQAAVLSALGMRVWSVERHAELLTSARRHLDAIGCKVATRHGDGTLGWSSFAPFDGILVTAGSPDIPENLVRQLSVGGKMVVPVGDKHSQSLQLIVRLSENEFTVEDRGEFRFVPLIGKRGWSE